MSSLAIAIGNTHIQAAMFTEGELAQVSQVRHGDLDNLVRVLAGLDFEQVAIASVVPNVITPWHGLVQTNLITLGQIPLHDLYAGMGIDRALAMYGAGLSYGFPVLAIDCGTAITINGVDQQRRFVGGAILPGLQTQLQSLSDRTAALPFLNLSEYSVNPNLGRWQNNTKDGILSGVIYAVVAGLIGFMQDWRSQYPESKLVITGGDSLLIWQFLPEAWQTELICDRYLVFKGMPTLFTAKAQES